MNTEKLLALARSLLWELNEYRLLPVLNELIEALKGGDAAGGRTEELLAVARELSAAAPSNAWPPSSVLMLQKIGGKGLVGSSAFDRLHALMSDYRLSSAATASLVAELHKEILHFEGILKNLVNTAVRLNLGPDELEPGSTEIGVVFPSPRIVVDLESLVREAKDLDAALRVFGELGGCSGSFRIRLVTSSSLVLFLTATASVGALLASAISKALDLYMKKLEIEKARLEIEKLKLEVSAAEELRQKEQAVIEDGLSAVAEELVTHSQVKNEGRRNELRTATRSALMYLIVNIERGVVFEVSSSPKTSSGAALPEAESGEGPETLEVRQLNYAADQGASMRSLAIQASLMELPEKAARDE